MVAPAFAQEPFDSPTLSDEPPAGQGSDATPTPSKTATATPTETATATSEPAATPRARRAQLARTGSEPLELALLGMTLLGFGMALRFRVALADARSVPH